VSALTQDTPAAAETSRAPEQAWRPPSYWPFVVPALIVVLAVIVFPWVFTIWMSLHEWKVGSPTVFVGLANYLRMPNDPRFVEAVWHTLVYTLLSVALPLIFGTLAAVVFHQKFPLRGLLRGIFIMPMMATPVAIALVWTMMFHPQLGVLNYLLSLVDLPAQLFPVAFAGAQANGPIQRNRRAHLLRIAERETGFVGTAPDNSRKAAKALSRDGEIHLIGQ